MSFWLEQKRRQAQQQQRSEPPAPSVPRRDEEPEAQTVPINPATESEGTDE